MPPPVKGNRLPPSDHVLRYVGKKHLDSSTNAVNGSGFLARPDEDAPSCNWLEYFPAPLTNQIAEIRTRKRFKYEKRGKLVRLNVSTTEHHVRDNLAAANLTTVAAILFVHDPLEAEDSKPADHSHSLASGVPQIGAGPAAELIGDLFLDCTLEIFDVSPD
jgi:hypothetical protein